MKVVTFLKARQIRSRKFPRKKLEKEKQSNMALTMTRVMRTLEGVMCTERSIDSDPSPEPRCIKHTKRATDAAAAALSSEDQQIKQEVDPTAPTKSTRFLGVSEHKLETIFYLHLISIF